MADPVSAAHREFPRDADRYAGSVRLRVARKEDETRGDDGWITRSHPPSALDEQELMPHEGFVHEPNEADGGHHGPVLPQHRHHFETEEQQREAGSFGMWLFLLTEIMFFGGHILRLPALPQLVLPGVCRVASNQLNVHGRRDQHGHPHHVGLLHGAGCVGCGGSASATFLVWMLVLTNCLRHRLSWRQGRLSTTRSTSTITFPAPAFRSLSSSTRRPITCDDRQGRPEAHGTGHGSNTLSSSSSCTSR